MKTTERFERAEKTIKELETFGKAQKKQNAFAMDCCVETCSPEPKISQADIQWLNDRINYLREDLNYFRERFYTHLEGHLPKIVGATAMNKALKALSLDGDYEVKPNVIYANDGSIEGLNLFISKPVA